LWYKHKRAKKDPQGQNDPQQNKSRKRRSPPSTPTETNGRVLATNAYINNNWHSSLNSSLPPNKKYRKDYEEESLIQPETYGYDGHYGQYSDTHYTNHVTGITHAPLNSTYTNGYVNHVEPQDAQDVISNIFNEEDEEDLLQQIEIENSKEPPVLEGFIESIRYFANPPRKSKRKAAAIKSPTKWDPVAITMEPNYHKLFTSGMNTFHIAHRFIEKNGTPTPFDFLYSAGNERVTTVKTLSQDISLYAPTNNITDAKTETVRTDPEHA
jgi:hypothetical protein